MRGPAQCPLLSAALVASVAVGLVVFSSVRPSDPLNGQATSGASKEELDARMEALEELNRAGLTGSVTIVVFGDGVGLGTTQKIPAGGTLLRIPEALALDPQTTRSCGEDSERLDCQIETSVSKAWASKTISRLTALLVLLIMERRRGMVNGLEPTASSKVLNVLPSLAWQRGNGLFAIDKEEFHDMALGTSMEGWQDTAQKDVRRALSYLRRSLPELTNVSVEEVQWAYLLLHSLGQWTDLNYTHDEQLDIPPQLHFLWPLFLARPTADWDNGVRVRHNATERMYEVFTPRALAATEELHFVDWRLSDASVLCFRGLWLASRHRAQISLDMSNFTRDPLSQPILNKYGCGSQPLRLYVQAQKSTDPLFLSCMRMLALSTEAKKLRKAHKTGWMANWPHTEKVNAQYETTAAAIAVHTLQHALDRLSTSNSKIRQRFGGDSVALRQTVKVREAEMLVIVSMLKSMKDWSIGPQHDTPS